jgi:SAM-dependent methyltransferase
MYKQLTDDDIEELYYMKVKKTELYFKKYELLPPCPVKQWNYDYQNFDFPRVWCVLDFKEWILKYNLSKVNTLGVTCVTDPELDFIKGDKIIHVDYPPYDLHTLSNSFTNTFDFFIFNQTIEHLYNPYASIRSIYDTIKSGGYVFTSVPTLNIPHMMPKHFTGFTPIGLATLFTVCGFEVVEVGQWGNHDYITKLFGEQSWPGYNRLHKDGRVTNEENNVCQCWILARKSL